jgi:hypothetical protein
MRVDMSGWYPGRRGAVISACGLFRYVLWRRWSGRPLLVFIMLNPSTADALKNDHTIRKCIGFARRFGFGGIIVVNLFAYRTTYPKELKKAGWLAGGTENMSALGQAMKYAGTRGVICAWGAEVRKVDPERLRITFNILRAAGVPLYSLLTLPDGIPGHPLMLPYDSQLQEFTL